MPRRLIWVSSPRQRLTGDSQIGPGYPRDYTAEQMRQWAHDLRLLDATSPEDLERWRVESSEQLSAEQRRVLHSQRVLNDPGDGISGYLRDDGVVELASGRHRAAYMMEQSVDSIPVWVSAQDSAALERFATECESERKLRGQVRQDLRPQTLLGSPQGGSIERLGRDPILAPERKPITGAPREPILIWERKHEGPERDEEPTR